MLHVIENRLRIILAEQYLKMADLSRMTRISERMINAIYHNRFTCINLEHMFKICEALGVKVEDIFVYKGD